MNYFFFHTVSSNTLLLKEWVKINFPEWNLSFSSDGWITYKTNIKNLIEQYPQFECPLALRWGIGLEVINLKEPVTPQIIAIIKNLNVQFTFKHIHYFEKLEIYSESNLMEKALTLSFPDKFINKIVEFKYPCLNLFKLKDTFFAMGFSSNLMGQSKFPGADPKIKLPLNCPSKAYLKIAQVCEYFSIRFSNKDSILELGSFPGGITTYLLENSCQVYSVDSAAMSLKHKNLQSLQCSVQHVNELDLPPSLNWIVSDLNLTPKQMLNEVIRIGRNIKNLKGIILTIKLPKVEAVRHLNHYLQISKKNFPYLKFKYVQVPSHGKETHLVGL